VAFALDWRSGVEVEWVEGRVLLVEQRGIVHHRVENLLGGGEERVGQLDQVLVYVRHQLHRVEVGLDVLRHVGQRQGVEALTSRLSLLSDWMLVEALLQVQREADESVIVGVLLRRVGPDQRQEGGQEDAAEKRNMAHFPASPAITV
jgi:hypothetical protein